MNKTICQAIQEMKLLEFTFHGHRRVVEPHTHGIDRKGRESLSAYQVSGTSGSGGVPDWRLFRTSEISFLTLSQQKFSNRRSGYKKGDSRMSRIFCEL